MMKSQELPVFISFGKNDLCDPAISAKKEWLVTNGIGSFASGTVSGELTRRYHGLLVAALTPPVNRTLLVSKLEEEFEYNGEHFSLSSNRWGGDQISPEGFENIESFSLVGSIPTWIFSAADALIEKKIWMELGSHTTYVHYRILRASFPVKLSIKAMVNWRGYHNLTQSKSWKMDVFPLQNGLKVQAFDKAAPFYILSDAGKCEIANLWYRNYYLKEEAFRGLDCVEDHLFAGVFTKTLKQGEGMTIVSSLEKSASVKGKESLKRRVEYEKSLLKSFDSSPDWIKQIALAADQFIVDRPLKNDPSAKTIIAGYHWFTDWGRDTMISLPGLTLSTGRPEIAKKILQTFSAYVDQGMIPNRFPDGNEAPEYNTVDAALWFFEAVRAYFEKTGDKQFLKEVFPVLEEIIHWYQKGTRYNIYADAKDGLLFCGEEGVQLTWMDAKVGDWVVTPRTGKPVEINALWYHALAKMAQFASALGKPCEKYKESASLALKSFSRFWNQETGCCFDVIDGPRGNDPSIRPNQIFAVSLPTSPLSADKQKKVVDIVAAKLLTSLGLRSLAKDNGAYQGFYGGNQRQRDGAYHQGTVWLWLLGPFCKAHLRVYKDSEAAKLLLEQIPYHLSAAGLGSCSEIFDGDAPMRPKGCISQAWSVAELLEAWEAIFKKSNL